MCEFTHPLSVQNQLAKVRKVYSLAVSGLSLVLKKKYPIKPLSNEPTKIPTLEYSIDCASVNASPLINSDMVNPKSRAQSAHVRRCDVACAQQACFITITPRVKSDSNQEQHST